MSAAPQLPSQRFSQVLAAAAESGPAALGPAATSPLLGGSPIDPFVNSVVHDHRLVSPGSLFVARRGERFDAHEHLGAAVAAGAVAVVGEVPPGALPLGLGVPYAQVADGRLALPHLAAALHRFPSRSLRVIGVTGTDGKTTTSYMLQHALQADRPVGLISTAAVKIGGTEQLLPGHFTTPEASDVQRLLAQIRDAGAVHAVLESSSHGFALHRLDAVEYAVGVWTNLSPEHLDHHRTYAAYRDAKLELVRRAEASVLNLDDAEHAAFAAASRGPVVSYGRAPEAEFRLLDVRSLQDTVYLAISAHGEYLNITLPMMGAYNAHNALAALAVAVHEGVPVESACARLETFTGVPGRMQVVAGPSEKAPVRAPFTVVVDFAHTGPALEKALTAVKPEAPARLILVVGAAGERDPGKRVPIANAATALADLTVFTEEDSRSEPTETILDELGRAAEAAGAQRSQEFELIADRREAIAAALRAAQPGDVVLLAGKGHERTLERSSETLAWDEAAEARAALRSVL